MQQLHVVRSKDAGAVLKEFGAILWTRYGETVVDGATDVQLEATEPISSDELLRTGFMAGARVAMVEMLSGHIEMEFIHDKKAEVPKGLSAQAGAVRTPVRSLSGRALRWLRRRFWGR